MHKDLLIIWAGNATAIFTVDISAALSTIVSISTLTFTGIRFYHEYKERKSKKDEERNN
jgi:hypothetical protein